MRNRIECTDRELHTILAALRKWQRSSFVEQNPELQEIATNGYTLDPLSKEDIDALAERIQYAE